VKSISLVTVTPEEARKKVKSGKAAIAAIIPDGFMAQMTAAFGDDTAKRPQIEFITDPTRSIEAQMAQGIIQGGFVGAAVSEKYGSQFDTQNEKSAPFETKNTDLGPEKAKLDEEKRSASVAHIFCGMALQGVLFGAIEGALQLMRDRQRGMLKRLTAAPISPKWFLLGRMLSSAIRAFFVLCIVLAFGMLVFKFRITGSLVGLGLAMVTTSLMSASFGLFVSALGKTEAQSRGLSTLAVLVLSMLGGAWFPSFMFPGWVQTISKLVPTRWAIDSLDAALWRGMGVVEILPLIGVTLAFVAAFVTFGLLRFSWEGDAA
jgi:ABC-2 type transport system permease protein